MEYEISVQDLQRLQNHSLAEAQNRLCLLDVRQPWEAELAALPDSRLIPMNELLERAQKELDPNAHIIVYCHHGIRSLNVVMWLRDQGFAQAQSLAGGIEAWSQTIDPSIPSY